MSDLVETIQEAVGDSSHSSFNSIIAALVALTATFMAICNIKDGNIVQNMAQAQTRSVDAWTYYQAKSTKQLLSENMAEQAKTQLAVNSGLTPESRATLAGKVTQYETAARRYEKEKEEIKKEAEGYQQKYDDLNVHDDQFDMAEACFTVAIALYGITALLKKKWLLLFAFALSAVGTVLGLAGFLGWSLHPDWLARLLG